MFIFIYLEKKTTGPLELQEIVKTYSSANIQTWNLRLNIIVIINYVFEQIKHSLFVIIKWNYDISVSEKISHICTSLDNQITLDLD